MRILYVHHTLPPDSFAGSEIYHYRLAQAMAPQHEVMILYREANPALPEYALREREELGMTVFAINNTFKECTSFEMTYRNRDIERRFDELLTRLQPQIVHFGHVTCLSTGLPAVARHHGARVFMTVHDFWLLCQRGQLLRRDYSLCSGPTPSECSSCLADQMTLSPRTKQAARLAGAYLDFATSPFLRRLASWYSIAHLWLSREAKEAYWKRADEIQTLFDSVDCFISPSEFLRGVFIKHGVPEDKIIYSQNGLEKNFLASYERTSSAILRLGYIGSVMPSKGLHVLLEAMKRVKGDNISLTVHGAFQTYHGDATYESQIRRLLAQPRVTYAGHFEHGLLGRILSDIDVLVVPSVWYENAPLTIQEAFEAGIPVVASDLGGMREYVTDGTDGLLFKPGSSDHLARVLEKLVADRDLVNLLARGTIPQKSVSENADELGTLYRNYLDKRR